MPDILDQLSLPPLPVSLYPARLEQTVVAEWQPFQQLAAKHRRPSKKGRRLTAGQRRTITASCLVALVGALALSRESTRTTVASPGVAIRQALQRRAALEISDNFRMNATQWKMPEGNGWKRDQEGFVRPGSLALFRPSLSFGDYSFEFLAQIERKSVGWVFRARDEKNYYAMKVTVLEPGPRPIVGVVRYPVIDGRREKITQAPIPVMFHNNVPYRVQVRVSGNRFTTLLEGQVVDHWTDDRITTGGVGFFSEAGEVARLYWMRVSRNTDLLGRICAMVAKRDRPSTGQPLPGPDAGWTEATYRIPWHRREQELCSQERCGADAAA